MRCEDRKQKSFFPLSVTHRPSNTKCTLLTTHYTHGGEQVSLYQDYDDVYHNKIARMISQQNGTV